MKLRREARGLHYYDRVTGFHFLLDELPVPPEQCDIGPATVSVAVTNACDLHCYFCYASKAPHRLHPNDLTRWCGELSRLGTLEIAFGGGEPFLFPEFDALCKRIWQESDLGISVTTHGHRLNERVIDSLAGNVSILRFSIDAPEPEYSAIRQRPLRALLDIMNRASASIPIAVNTVVTKSTLQSLDRLAEVLCKFRIVDWLLLPQLCDGKFLLNEDEWLMLRHWLVAHESNFRFCVASEAVRLLQMPVLLNPQPRDYAHIDAAGFLRSCSYDNGGIPLMGNDVRTSLRQLWGGIANGTGQLPVALGD